MTSGTSDRVGRSLADEPRERTLALDTLTSRLVAAGLVLLMDAVGDQHSQNRARACYGCNC